MKKKWCIFILATSYFVASRWRHVTCFYEWVIWITRFLLLNHHLIHLNTLIHSGTKHKTKEMTVIYTSQVKMRQPRWCALCCQQMWPPEGTEYEIKQWSDSFMIESLNYPLNLFTNSFRNKTTTTMCLFGDA